MSAVEMIKTAIARIKSAKEKLRTWLTNAGVTVPDGTKLDGMVDMLDDVSVSGGDDWEITDASRLFYGGSRVRKSYPLPARSSASRNPRRTATMSSTTPLTMGGKYMTPPPLNTRGAWCSSGGYSVRRVLRSCFTAAGRPRPAVL